MHPAMATINEHQPARSRNGNGGSRHSRRLGRINSREDPYLPSNRPRRRDTVLPVRLPSRDSKKKRTQMMLSRTHKEQLKQQQIIQKKQLPPNSPHKLLLKTPSSSTLSTANSSFSDLAHSSFGSSFSSGCSLDDIAPAPTQSVRQSRWGESSAAANSSTMSTAARGPLTPPASPWADTPLRSIPRRPRGSPSSHHHHQPSKRSNNPTQNSMPPSRRSSHRRSSLPTTTNIQQQQPKPRTKTRAVRTMTHPSARAATAKVNNPSTYQNQYNTNSALGRVLAALSDDETDDHVFVRRSASNKGLISNMALLLAEDTIVPAPYRSSFPRNTTRRRRSSVDDDVGQRMPGVFATSSQKKAKQPSQQRTSHHHSLRGRRTTGSIILTTTSSTSSSSHSQNSNSSNNNNNNNTTIMGDDSSSQRRRLVGDLVRALEESDEEHIFCSRRHLFSYASDDDSWYEEENGRWNES